jgi:pyrroloquinoline quinone biosynthesis protein D
VTEIPTSAVPTLPRGVKFRFDEARNRHVLLAPERAFGLDDAAVAVIELVDGRRTIDEIADILAARFDAPREVIASDIVEMLRDLAQKRVVDL